MKKMKNLIGILVLILATMSLFSGCVSTPVVPSNLMVDSDPNNPYQGTWINKKTLSSITVIRGYVASTYVNLKPVGFPIPEWQHRNNFNINPSNNTYVFDDVTYPMQLSNNNNTLTMHLTEYERCVRAE